MSVQSIYGHQLHRSKTVTRLCLGKNLSSPEHWASVRWGTPEKLSVWESVTPGGHFMVALMETKRDKEMWGPQIFDLCASGIDASLSWPGNESGVAAYWCADWCAVGFKDAEDAEEFRRMFRSSKFQQTSAGPEFSW